MTFSSMLAARNIMRTLACSLGFFALVVTAMANGSSAETGEGVETDGPQPTVRLISEAQYLNTVQSIFGPHIKLNVRFAPVRRTQGMVALGAAQAMVTPGALDSLDRAAHLVAKQVVDPANRDFVIPCSPDDSNVSQQVCATQFFREVGRLLYRRPLTDNELKSLVDVAGSVTEKQGNFYEGLESVLVGMLLSPHFLFVQELVEPDPERPGKIRLDAYSKASRLSLLLWASGPDSALLDAAESGALHRDAQVRQQVERMLASPRLKDGARAFFDDFLILEDFDNLTKDQTIFPVFTTKALDDAREQQLQIVLDHLIQQNGDYRDLFTTSRTMMTSNLAGLYGISVNAEGSQWVAHDFDPQDERAGFLSQVGFLAQHAHPGRSSPTRRGRALREIMLCQKVPDPPPNVDFSALESPDESVRTARERLKIHNTDRTCRGCHALTDPVGLGLENFDGAGQHRSTERGAVIDPSGTLDGVAFKTAVELGEAVRDNPALTECIVQRVYSVGVGRPMTEFEEAGVMDSLMTRLGEQGYRWKDLLSAVTLNDAFFNVAPIPAVSGASADVAAAYRRSE